MKQSTKPVSPAILMEPVGPKVINSDVSVTPAVVVETSNDYDDDENVEIRIGIAQQKGQVIVTEEYVKSILTDKQLGSGFFGTVYLGYDRKLQQQFAIKTINPEILSAGSSSPDIIQKVKDTFHNEQEVRLISS